MPMGPRKTKEDIEKIIKACKEDEKDNKGNISYTRVVRRLETNGMKADDSTVSRYWRVYKCVKTGNDIPENLCRFIHVPTWLEYFKDNDLLDNFRNAIINVDSLSEQEHMAIKSAGNERKEYEQQQIELEKPDENEEKHDDDHDEFVHHMAVSHAAIVMAHLQMKCDSWHLEDKKVTMTLPFEEWYDICRHYGVSEEVAGWASLY